MTVTFDFGGAKVLVTGGTSGIGHGVATAFRAAGAEVTVTGTRSGPSDYDMALEGLAYHRMDLTEPDAIDAVAESTTDLDILVNNAGATLGDEADPDGFAASVQLNLTAAYRLTGGVPVGALTIDAAGRRQRGQRGQHECRASIGVRSRLRSRQGGHRPDDPAAGPHVGR